MREVSKPGDAGVIPGFKYPVFTPGLDTQCEPREINHLLLNYLNYLLIIGIKIPIHAQNRVLFKNLILTQ